MNTEAVKHLNALKSEMKKFDIDACIIPSADCHLSEYVNECFKYRKYFSGFGGSAGTLFVSHAGSYLITDGRYYLQAERELEGSGITLVKDGMPGEPDVFALCERELKSGDSVFIDGRFVSAAFADKFSLFASKHGYKIDFVNGPIESAASDMPAQTFSPIYELPLELSGRSRADKLACVRSAMIDSRADAHVIISLEEIAWLLNMRSSDIKNTPVFYAYAYITETDAYVFVDENAASDVRSSLENDGITVMRYSDFYSFLSNITEKRVMCDKNACNAAVTAALPRTCEIIDKTDPAMSAKAVKNEVEIENLKRIHLYDGLALARFMHVIKNAKDGEYTELSATRKLYELRREASSDYNGDSFDTICAYEKNAAIVHYSATDANDTCIHRSAALLVDSGGQYSGGTTDVTRMFILGETSEEFKLHYTTVLRSMLRLQSTTFLKGTRCAVLDMIAREPVWKLGLDYRHGTGHGVGYMLSVHECPNRFHYANSAPPLEEGMVTSDEPGLYVEGKHGIRIENEILCVKSQTSEYGDFLSFVPLTVCPIDLDALLPEMLDSSEIAQLNAYHKYVYESLAELADPSELTWLREYTRAI